MTTLAALVGVVLAAGPLTARAEPAEPRADGSTSAPAAGPDVELHVPRAAVGKLSLEVENLEARLDVDTRVAKLVEIRAGVVATVQKLKVELEQVEAETHLVVRLDRVARVLERALAAVEVSPQLGVDAPPPAAPAATVNAAATLPTTVPATDPAPARTPTPAPTPTLPRATPATATPITPPAVPTPARS